MICDRGSRLGSSPRLPFASSFVSLCLLFLLPGSATALDFFVTPAGTTSTAPGTGTITNPWALATALAQPAAVHAGDTIWLRGGTYTGNFTSYLTGTPSLPIVVRQYPGERATLNGNVNASLSGSGAPVLTVLRSGGYTWYWGFEVTNSSPVRTDTNPCTHCRGDGIDVFATGTKIINCVVHDTGQGIGFWSAAGNSEVYGNLVYYNGYWGPDGGHGHGIDTQNDEDGSTLIRHNIIFDGLDGNLSWAAPTQDEVTILPNAYEPGRATIVVYNRDASAAEAVDLTGVVSPGAAYEIRNAQNFYGPPIVSGTYAGGLVTLPMIGLTPATPVGYRVPSSTGPAFAAFVVMTVPGSPIPTLTYTPTPTATPAPTPTPTRRPTPTWPSPTTPAPTPTRTPTPTPMPTSIPGAAPPSAAILEPPRGRTALGVPGPVVFPLVVSADRRYLQDQNGQPFPILGRASWSIISLTQADYKTYLDDTAAKGFNAIELPVINRDR